MEAQEQQDLSEVTTIALYKPTPGRPKSGPIKMSTTAYVKDLERITRQSGLSYVTVTAHPEGYVRDGIVVPYPQRPSESHVFDFLTDDWVDPRTLEQHKDGLRAGLAQRRWEAETGGLTLESGLRVLSGRADRDGISSLILTSEAAGIETVDFKAASGWVHLTLDGIRDIAQAIALHVQACFSAERAVSEAIDALDSVTAAEAFDVSAAWPADL